MNILEQATIEELFDEISCRVKCAVLIIDTLSSQEKGISATTIFTTEAAGYVHSLGCIEHARDEMKAVMQEVKRGDHDED